MPTTLLLSIHPEHADRIFSGEKVMELRRVRPRVGRGDRVVVYVTAPRMEIVGVFTIARLIESSPIALWRLAGPRACVQRRDYDAYFDGARRAYGICVAESHLFAKSISLATIKNLLPGFHPPQSHRYLDEQQQQSLLIANRKMAA